MESVEEGTVLLKIHMDDTTASTTAGATAKQSLEEPLCARSHSSLFIVAVAVTIIIAGTDFDFAYPRLGSNMDKCSRCSSRSSRQSNMGLQRTSRNRQLGKK